MSKSAFIDKNHQPSETDVVAVLREAHANWILMLEEMRKVGRIQEDFKFLYGKPYGWGIRFRLKGKLFAAFYPNQNHFVAQVVLGPKQVAETDNIHLHSNAKEAIQNANPYPEGKWLFIKVESGSDMEDVRKLLKLKLKIVKWGQWNA
jgi:hypothetical protein